MRENQENQDSTSHLPLFFIFFPKKSKMIPGSIRTWLGRKQGQMTSSEKGLYVFRIVA